MCREERNTTPLHPAADPKGPPIRTNIRTDEFVLARDDHRCRSSTYRQQAKRRLLAVYKQRDVAPVPVCTRSAVRASPGSELTRTAFPHPASRLPQDSQTAPVAGKAQRPAHMLGACLHLTTRFPSAAYQLTAHSTACRSKSWAELGRVLRFFIWQPERMRRPITCKAERTLR